MGGWTFLYILIIKRVDQNFTKPIFIQGCCKEISFTSRKIVNGSHVS